MTLNSGTQAAHFWSVSVEEAADILETDIHHGLSDSEVERRRAIFGGNTIEHAHRSSALVILANQFKSPLILILLVAVAIMLLIAHYRDALFIFIAVLANVTLGFYQEHKAERALAELETDLKQRARVGRGGVDGGG